MPFNEGQMGQPRWVDEARRLSSAPLRAEFASALHSRVMAAVKASSPSVPFSRLGEGETKPATASSFFSPLLGRRGAGGEAGWRGVWGGLAAAAGIFTGGLAISFWMMYGEHSVPGPVEAVSAQFSDAAPVVAEPAVAAEEPHPLPSPSPAGETGKRNRDAAGPSGLSPLSPVGEGSGVREVTVRVALERDIQTGRPVAVLHWQGEPLARYRVTSSDRPDEKNARYLEWVEVTGSRWSDRAPKAGMRFYRVEKLDA